MKRFLFFSLLCLILSVRGCHSRPRAIAVGIALTQTNHSAVRLAAQEINAQGGIGGVPLELVGMDWHVVDNFDSMEVLKWSNRFADTKNVVAVIGHSDSASTLSAAAIYNQKKIPQIATIATNPAITNIGSWTYRLCISDAAQGPALAEYAVKDWGKKRAATFYVNDDYGRGLAQLFEKRVRELGAEVIASTMHRNVLGADDKELIRSVLLGLKKTREPDLIALFQRSGAAHWTMQTVRDLGLRSDFLGGDNLSVPSFIQPESGLAEGMRISQFFFPHPDQARPLEFIQKYRQFAGEEPDYGGAFAYDAVYLLRDAIQQGGYTREGVKSYLDRLIREKTVVHGAGGDYRLGADHDARREINIVKVHAGKQEFLKAVSVN